jgi:hypothetical protein
MEIKADIVDYMGRYEGGVLVLLSVNCDGEFMEGTIFYTERDIVLTLDPSVEERLGMPISKWDGYRGLLSSILSRLVPPGEMMGRLDEVDFDKYIEVDKTSSYVDWEIDPSDIISSTQSNL